jgi:hypothetical protein
MGLTVLATTLILPVLRLIPKGVMALREGEPEPPSATA